MGAKDRFGFTIVYEDIAGLTNKLRLQVAVSGDGSIGETGPFHRWADVHSHYDETEEAWVLDEEAVSERDAQAVRTIQRLCIIAETWTGADLSGIGDAIRGVMRAAWGEAVTDHIMAVVTNNNTEVEAGVGAILKLESAKGIGAGVAL